MGILTSDKDLGEGGGLAICILHLHCVGGCVLNGASEKERRHPPPAPRLLGSIGNSSPHVWVGKAGINTKPSQGETLGFSSGPTSEKLCAFGLATALWHVSMSFSEKLGT